MDKCQCWAFGREPQVNLVWPAVLHCTSVEGVSEFDSIPQDSEALEKDFRLDGVQNDKEVLAGHFRVVIGKVTNRSSREA